MQASFSILGECLQPILASRYSIASTCPTCQTSPNLDSFVLLEIGELITVG